MIFISKFMTRIMCYNIHHPAPNVSKQISQFIIDQKLNILGCEEVDDLKEFSDAILPYNFFAKANTRHNLAFLATKSPLRIIQINEGFWHTVVLSVYSITQLGEVAIVLLHLNPRDEDARLAELEKLMPIVKPFSHCILMGDFNSLSPSDPYNHSDLLTTFQDIGLKKFGTTSLRFDCINFLKNHGLMDVMDALQKPFMATVPTPTNVDFEHAATLRLDYMFISPSLVTYLTNAEVIKNKITGTISDHYPILADFNFQI